jgi:hypothetical protein
MSSVIDDDDNAVVCIRLPWTLEMGHVEPFCCLVGVAVSKCTVVSNIPT